MIKIRRKELELQVNERDSQNTLLNKLIDIDKNILSMCGLLKKVLEREPTVTERVIDRESISAERKKTPDRMFIPSIDSKNATEHIVSIKTEETQRNLSNAADLLSKLEKGN